MRTCAHLQNCHVRLIKFKTGHCWSQNFQIWFFTDLIFHKVERLRLGFLKLKKHSMQVKNQVWIWLFIGWFCWTRSAQKHFQAKWKIRSASNNSFFHSEPQEKQKTIFKASETGTFKRQKKSQIWIQQFIFHSEPQGQLYLQVKVAVPGEQKTNFKASEKSDPDLIFLLPWKKQMNNQMCIWFFTGWKTLFCSPKVLSLTQNKRNQNSFLQFCQEWIKKSFLWNCEGTTITSFEIYEHHLKMMSFLMRAWRCASTSTTSTSKQVDNFNFKDGVKVSELRCQNLGVRT